MRKKKSYLFVEKYLKQPTIDAAECDGVSGRR